MSFFEQTSNLKEIPVTVLTPGFQARCLLPVFGVVQTFINDDQKGVFSLKEVTLHGLEASNPAASMTLNELYVRKNECHLIAFESKLSSEDAGMMPRAEQLVVYTSHYAIQAQFYMGSDALISDFIDSSRSQFIVITDVHVFPLFQPRAAVIQHAPVAFMHTKTVQMHHPA